MPPKNQKGPNPKKKKQEEQKVESDEEDYFAQAEDDGAYGGGTGGTFNFGPGDSNFNFGQGEGAHGYSKPEETFPDPDPSADAKEPPKKRAKKPNVSDKGDHKKPHDFYDTNFKEQTPLGKTVSAIVGTTRVTYKRLFALTVQGLAEIIAAEHKCNSYDGFAAIEPQLRTILTTKGGETTDDELKCELRLASFVGTAKNIVTVQLDVRQIYNTYIEALADFGLEEDHTGMRSALNDWKASSTALNIRQKAVQSPQTQPCKSTFGNSLPYPLCDGLTNNASQNVNGTNYLGPLTQLKAVYQNAKEKPMTKSEASQHEAKMAYHRNAVIRAFPGELKPIVAQLVNDPDAEGSKLILSKMGECAMIFGMTPNALPYSSIAASNAAGKGFSIDQPEQVYEKIITTGNVIVMATCKDNALKKILVEAFACMGLHHADVATQMQFYDLPGEVQCWMTKATWLGFPGQTWVIKDLAKKGQIGAYPSAGTTVVKKWPKGTARNFAEGTGVAQSSFAAPKAFNANICGILRSNVVSDADPCNTAQDALSRQKSIIDSYLVGAQVAAPTPAYLLIKPTMAEDGSWQAPNVNPLPFNPIPANPHVITGTFATDHPHSLRRKTCEVMAATKAYQKGQNKDAAALVDKANKIEARAYVRMVKNYEASLHAETSYNFPDDVSSNTGRYDKFVEYTRQIDDDVKDYIKKQRGVPAFYLKSLGIEAEAAAKPDGYQPKQTYKGFRNARR